MNTQLFINVAAQSLSAGLVRSVTDMTPVSIPDLVIGDGRFYDLYFVDGLGDYASFSGDPSYIPYIAIGECGYPSGGTFTLTFNGQTTSALPNNATLAAVQAALQTLSSIGAGNCVVTGVPGQYYVVTFTGTLGGAAQNEITATFSLLTPDSTIDVSTIVTGGAGVNCVQLLSLAENPITFADTWTPITNGWTGQLSIRTLQAIQKLAAAGGSFADTFQVTLADPSGNRTTYFQGDANVYCTIINPESFAGADKPLLATQAALNAAVLGLNNFTFETDTSSGTGNTNISPPASSRYHTAIVTLTGTAGTRTLSILTSGPPVTGALVRLVLLPAATANIVIEVHNATAGGTLLKSITTDTSGRPYAVIVSYNGSAWVLAEDNAHLLPADGNLAGLASTLTSKVNLATLFNTLVNESVSWTIATADQGKLFMVSAAGGNVLATLPSAVTAGAGFLVALKKTDSSAYTVTTSPATYTLAMQGDVIILVSDGTNWNVLIYANTSGTGGAVTAAILRLQVVQNGYALTALVGGTSSCLDGLATADGTYATGAVVEVILTGPIILTYRLRAGTDAQNDPWIVRPADYNGSTNAKVWELLRVTENGYPLVWNSTQSKWQAISATGASGSEIIHFGTGFVIS